MGKIYRVYDERGKYVGTLAEILTFCLNDIAEQFKNSMVEDRKNRFTVQKDEACPVGYKRYTDGCGICYRNQYCESYEKEES